MDQSPSQGKGGRLAVETACALIRFYQYATFGGVRRCRFAPSCSAYAIDALRANGVWRGTWQTLQRLSKCHPWNAGGWDPVMNEE